MKTADVILKSKEKRDWSFVFDCVPVNRIVALKAMDEYGRQTFEMAQKFYDSQYEFKTYEDYKRYCELLVPKI
jgi:hypothetical protein